MVTNPTEQDKLKPRRRQILTAIRMLNLKYAEESSRMRICVVFHTNFNVSGKPAASISGQKCSSVFHPEDESRMLS